MTNTIEKGAQYTLRNMYKPASETGINIDHIGGNNTSAIPENKFLEHYRMTKKQNQC
ncbi:MAG: F420-0:gamma-glutamyl ligase-like protein [Saprospiraceae bacterium]|jgi:F420-0:gamma-glutamyl ligase-like protein